MDILKELNISNPCNIYSSCRNGSAVKGFHFQYYEEGKKYTKTTNGYNYKTKHVRCIETNEVFESLNKAKRSTGCKDIHDAIIGKQSKSSGLHWEYTDLETTDTSQTVDLIKKTKEGKKLFV